MRLFSSEKLGSHPLKKKIYIYIYVCIYIYCTDEAQKAEKSLQLTLLFVECLPEDLLRVKPLWIWVRLYRHLSVFLFAALPVYSFNFWWCSALSPFGVERPALPCGLA